MTGTLLREPRRKKTFLKCPFRPFLANYSCFKKAFSKYWVVIILEKCKPPKMQIARPSAQMYLLNGQSRERLSYPAGLGGLRCGLVLPRTYSASSQPPGQRLHLFLGKELWIFSRTRTSSLLWVSTLMLGPLRKGHAGRCREEQRIQCGMPFPGEVCLSFQFLSWLLKENPYGTSMVSHFYTFLFIVFRLFLWLC